MRINKSVLFWIIAFSISVPLFLGLSSNGINIIQLWDRKDAFPIHISLPFVVILGFYYHAFTINSEKIIVFSFYIIFITLCNFIYVSQLFLLFVFYYTFRSMPQNEFIDLIKKVTVTALVFATFHLIGYLINMSILNLGTKGSYVMPFGFFIYQGLISYPPFMFIILLIVLRLNGSWLQQFILFIVSLLSQRTATLLYLSFFILKEKFRWVIIIVFSVSILFIFGYSDVFVDAILGRFIWRIESGTIESGRISNWSLIFSELSTFSSVFLGPQIPGNTLHNYWLNTTNHIGLLGLTFFIIIILLFLLRSSILDPKNLSYTLPFLFWFLLDTNVNSPLSQMYTQLIFCLYLIFCEKWNPKFVYKKSNNFKFKFPIEIDAIKILKFIFLFILFMIVCILYLNLIGFQNEYFIHISSGN